jgi:hypothetical protein
MNNSSTDVVYPVSITASQGSLTRTVTLPSITVYTVAHEGTLIHLPAIETLLTQSDDVSQATEPDGLSVLSNTDYYLGTTSALFQQAEGVQGPSVYLSQYVTGGSSNGTVASKLVDINGDSIPDNIAFSRFNGISINLGIWPMPVSGQLFGSISVVLPSASPDDGSVSDINQDGKPDLVWIEQYKVIYALNAGNGVFQTPVEIRVPELTDSEKLAVTSNAGGPPEIVALDGFGAVVVLSGPGFTQKTVMSATCGFRDVATGDINGDGLYDVIIACGGQSSAQYLLQGVNHQFVSQSYNWPDSGNWIHGQMITVKGQTNILMADVQYQNVYDILFSGGVAQTPPTTLDIGTDVLPGVMRIIDGNHDGFQDFIAGLDGYVSPYGSPIMRWLQVPWN